MDIFEKVNAWLWPERWSDFAKNLATLLLLLILFLGAQLLLFSVTPQ
jgi:hypothetical protein